MVLRSEAAPPSVMYEYRQNYYYYDTLKRRYVMDPTETEIDYVRSGTRVQVAFHVREGYSYTKMVMNNSVVSYEGMICLVLRSTHVDIYFDPIPTYTQTYRYYRYDAEKKEYILVKTLKDKAQKGKIYTTEIQCTEPEYHVEEVRFNDQKRSSGEDFSYRVEGDNVIDVYWYPDRTIPDHILLRYHTRGNRQEEVFFEEQYKWEENVMFRNRDDPGQPEKPATLLGWSLKTDGKEAVYLSGTQMSVEDLYMGLREQGVIEAEEKEPVIDLYPVWDMAPVFGIRKIYVTRKEALEGMVTPEYLAGKLGVTDQEEGNLSLQKENDLKVPGIRFDNYATERFLAGNAGDVVLYVQARDSIGNVTEAQVICTIVDSSGTYLGKTKKVRFISEEYLDTLKEDSIWNRDQQYRILLEEVLEKARCIMHLAFLHDQLQKSRNIYYSSGISSVVFSSVAGRIRSLSILFLSISSTLK